MKIETKYAILILISVFMLILLASISIIAEPWCIVRPDMTLTFCPWVK